MKRLNTYIQSLAAGIILLLFVSCARQPADQVSESIFQKDWSSLQEHQTPEWFLDAKFGIYCHWGPYSVPAFENEWYAHWMYCNENNPEAKRGERFYKHHINKYGPLDEFGYKDFIPMFTAEKFDPAEWAQIFKDAGARFAGPVSEHADGFAMWDSQLTKWDAMDMGPNRDIMGELSKEIRDRDMKFIATYHRHWLFGWYPTWDETTDASNPEYAGLYGPKLKKGDFQYPPNPHELDEGVTRYYPVADNAFNQEWLDRLKEIVDKYEPDLVWFDNKMDVIGESYRKDFLQYYYGEASKKEQEVVVTYKFYDLPVGTAVLDLERSRMSEKRAFPWLTDDSIDWKSWSDIEKPDYKTTNRLIDFLIDVVSKNGCLLLNITPKANGEIPEPVKERLKEMGAWLAVNGEAIYGTRPFEVYGEGDATVTEGHLSENKNPDNTAKDIRFTTKRNVLYATSLGQPVENLSIRSLGTNTGLLKANIQSIIHLNSGKEVVWNQRADTLEILIAGLKLDEIANVFKINLDVDL